MLPSTLQYTLHEDDILIHLHIPKTGGVSLTKTLQKQFELGKCINNPHISLPELTHTALAPYKLISGHFTYNIQDVISGNPIFVTMLRHPIDRIISFYHFVRSKPNNNFYFIANQTSFEEFIEFDNIAIEWHVQNQMTAMLCGYDFRSQRPTEDDLLLAKERLKQMPFLGLTEFFEESMRLLHYTFQWGHDFQVLHKNATVMRPSRQQISDVTTRRILDDNQLDLELYNYALSLFHQRLQTMLDETWQNEHHLQTENQVLSQSNQELKMKNHLLDLRNQQLEHQLHQPKLLTMLYRSILPFNFRIFLHDTRITLLNLWEARYE